MSKKVFEYDFLGKKLVVETGEYAKQANALNAMEADLAAKKALDKDFTDLYKVKKYLKDILDSEVNYNYVCNKNNSYALIKVVYNDSTKDWDCYEVLPEISIKDYSYMSYEDKEKYFKVND